VSSAEQALNLLYWLLALLVVLLALVIWLLVRKRSKIDGTNESSQAGDRPEHVAHKKGTKQDRRPANQPHGGWRSDSVYHTQVNFQDIKGGFERVAGALDALVSKAPERSMLSGWLQDVGKMTDGLRAELRGLREDIKQVADQEGRLADVVKAFCAEATELRRELTHRNERNQWQRTGLQTRSASDSSGQRSRPEQQLPQRSPHQELRSNDPLRQVPIEPIRSIDPPERIIAASFDELDLATGGDFDRMRTELFKRLGNQVSTIEQRDDAILFTTAANRVIVFPWKHILLNRVWLPYFELTGRANVPIRRVIRPATLLRRDNTWETEERGAVENAD
jgi:hypothetical protein